MWLIVWWKTRKMSAELQRNQGVVRNDIQMLKNWKMKCTVYLVDGPVLVLRLWRGTYKFLKNAFYYCRVTNILTFFYQIANRGSNE